MSELFEQGRLQPGMMWVKVNGKITITQMEASQQAGTDEMLAHGEQRWVVILDLTDGSMPAFDLNLAAMRRVIQRDRQYAAGYVILGATTGVKFLLSAYERIFDVPMLLASSKMGAVTIAEQLIASEHAAVG